MNHAHGGVGGAKQNKRLCRPVAEFFSGEYREHISEVGLWKEVCQNSLLVEIFPSGLCPALITRICSFKANVDAVCTLVVVLGRDLAR